MRILVTTLLAILMLTAAPAVAEASPTYHVSKSVWLDHYNGANVSVPKLPDNELTVTCRKGGKMVRWSPNRGVLGAWVHVNGRGVTVQPGWVQGQTVKLTVKLTCRG